MMLENKVVRLIFNQLLTTIFDIPIKLYPIPLLGFKSIYRGHHNRQTSIREAEALA